MLPGENIEALGNRFLKSIITWREGSNGSESGIFILRIFEVGSCIKMGDVPLTLVEANFHEHMMITVKRSEKPGVFPLEA